MILILSRDSDIHAQRVSAMLTARGDENLVFNPALFPLEASVAVRSTPDGPRATLEWAGQCLDLAQVTAVWLRRPESAQLGGGLRPGEDSWLLDECARLFDSLWAHMADALWVSKPHHIRHANLKLRQLELAVGLGFVVPDYLVTNKPDEARRFIEAHHDGVIVKALHTPALMAGDRAATIYTHLIEPSDLEVLDSVRFGPTFFQAFVKKRRDLRITVVGDQIFPVAIDSTVMEDAWTDFRRAEVFDMPHDPIDLPPELERACCALVSALDLNFGAIDILETEDGGYQFLEINPNGQWMWIEWITELPISLAMCDLLASGGSRP